jgi:hypothetical protein
MKLAFAIVCSLLLIWTQSATALSAAAGSAQAAKACCHCGSGCCASPANPEPQSTPVAPVSTSAQQELALATLPVLLWSLPGIKPSVASPFFASPTLSASAPLFARHCARLI